MLITAGDGVHCCVTELNVVPTTPKRCATNRATLRASVVNSGSFV
jgi:hypothetical protein